MALPFYMTLKGQTQGPIDGSNLATGHEKEIQCHALEQSLKIPYNDKTGQPSGLCVGGAFKIFKSFDKASPKLYQALVTGERMPEVVCKFFRIAKTGQEEHYFTITLKDATIVEVKPLMFNHFDLALAKYDHIEEISFTYAQIDWRWEVDGIAATWNQTSTA
jgi:type VI secretion system secreted protein Hcp